MHACSKCGCTVFTLSPPNSGTSDGVRINTGIKLATCMECGSQDRPKEVDQYIKDKEEAAWKEQALRKEIEKRKQYEMNHPYEQLLAEWLRLFNQYAGGRNNESRDSRNKYSIR